MLLYSIVTEVLANFTDADTRSKGVQIGDHEMKTLNFPDDTTIFLRDINCLTRIQLILKLYEKVSTILVVIFGTLQYFSTGAIHHK